MHLYQPRKGLLFFPACKPSEKFGSTVCALFLACLCGVVGVVFFLVWLCLWIAGTYFVVVAIGEMRTPKETHVDDHRIEASCKFMLRRRHFGLDIGGGPLNVRDSASAHLRRISLTPCQRQLL